MSSRNIEDRCDDSPLHFIDEENKVISNFVADLLKENTTP
tara:strand:- start:275 stop:394 length:120 start_codon:yes stop_codon:yes gene_type:complete